MAIAERTRVLYEDALRSVEMPEDAARENAKELLSLMQPTIDEWKVLEASMIANGEKSARMANARASGR